jgi:RecJ-like exonuclease
MSNLWIKSNYWHPIHNPDPRMFDGLFRREVPTYMKDPVDCPVCKGHGQWRLFANMSGSCNQCGGHGYVPASRAKECIHEWVETAKIGNCLYLHTCAKCGATRQVDSGD